VNLLGDIVGVDSQMKKHSISRDDSENIARSDQGEKNHRVVAPLLAKCAANQRPSENIWASMSADWMRGDTGMALHKFNVNFMFLLASDLQTISNQAAKEPRVLLRTPLIRAGIYLEGYFGDLISSQTGRPLLPLPTSKKSGLELRAHLNKMFDSTSDTETYSQPFDEGLVEEFEEKFREFRTVLGADLGVAATYVVHQPGVLSVDSLIAGASAVFEGYLDRVPEAAKWDTDQAGRCIAFDLPTAAGFHIARATETILLKYLQAFGQSISKESQRNWGQYTKIMRDNSAGSNEKVLSTIDQIRKLHRNPLLHPDVTLIMAEALGLWAICCSAIQAMIADMERKETAPKQEILDMIPPDTVLEGSDK
jgi:hypothetical protein